ncbi:MAG: hypothetical protein HGA33_05630 [Candidatus Moranbacteria bacterium]|nr:hypothetical protein [Candidatus Moranbacteria bacterium]
MNIREIRNILEGYGLDEKEASLYLSALNLGDSGMSELAKEAGLKRSTAYLIFQSLERKGLMGSFKMKTGLRFVATRPEMLVSKTKKQLEDLQSILPELAALSKKNGEDPKVTYYHGEEGYMTALEASLQERNAVLRHVGSIMEAHKVYADYDVNHYVPERLKKNISIRCLYTSDTSKAVRERDHSSERRDIRYFPEGYPIKTGMLIYGNRVVITSTKRELVTVVIESADIADSERLKFDLLWSLLK